MAPGHSVPTSSFKFDAIGTSWEIDTLEPLRAEMRDRVLDLVDEFDSSYSRFRHDSLVTRIAKSSHGGTFSFPADAVPMLELYDRLHAATGGAVDPLVGRDLELLGYDAGYSLVPDEDAAASAETQRPVWCRDVLREGARIKTRGPIVVDVGAVGKGRLVDLVAGVLTAEGLKEFVVDASGDMRHAGETALDVGLEHPLDAGSVIGVAKVKNASICASASNRRRWGDGLHHVIDGRTGRPTTDVIATWAIAPDTATADGLATALFFVSSSRLAKTFDFSFVRMFADGRVEVSNNFEGEVFT
ncbi:MAG: FAD:protein FMN transferase [Alphaproteobacteria bacterium]|nr:FAD:protein FMN transferase [Alphaproteobacteria bacterium]MBU1552092.1 FAD:protein FMN transferase [Alphaproteobacteria bacterium]MBU2337965.1 FAD:protein FMN transferase [Alphaproteobacteria bacterium]MBU2386350.1 FAD:protein FMN transferase [Alphaproteobacteria bacterium]